MITEAANKDTILTLELLEELIGEEERRKVGVRLWDGTRWPDEVPRPVTLVLNHPGALNAMFRFANELGLAEAYLYDDFDIVGDIESVFGLVDSITARVSSWRVMPRLARLLMGLPCAQNPHEGGRTPARLEGELHSIYRDRLAVTYHYDVSNEFYSLWLDRNMVYSCGYFHSPGDRLDTAQVHKLDYICRKLRLRPGQRLLDIGCGWGGLAIHAARRYGVNVTGITLSRPQADLANSRIEAAGLKERARARVCDYRLIAADELGDFDALVSVGMFEHVGASELASYFSHAWGLLKPGGVFLNHGIACRADATPSDGPGFMETYVFPDGELTPISVTLAAAEEAGFEVRDVESLREHYTLTLRQWVRRLESHHDQALQYVDEPTYRVWRLYMAGVAHAFSVGRLNVYQTLLVKPDEQGRSGLPLTRDDWYSPRMKPPFGLHCGNGGHRN